MARRNSNKRSNNPLNTNAQRQRVATEAARIMATEGQHQYLNAKQKAAQRLGIDHRAGLPSNHEIAIALRDYLSLFGGPERERAVHKLLQTALEAMHWLGAWRPRLCGALAEGLADKNTPIRLHVFSDDPDGPLRDLMERGLPYRQNQKRIRWYSGHYRTIETLSFQAGAQTVELWVFSEADQRQAPPSPIDGRPRERLDLSEVQQLLEQQRQRLSG